VTIFKLNAYHCMLFSSSVGVSISMSGWLVVMLKYSYKPTSFHCHCHSQFVIIVFKFLTNQPFNHHAAILKAPIVLLNITNLILGEHIRPKLWSPCWVGFEINR